MVVILHFYKKTLYPILTFSRMIIRNIEDQTKRFIIKRNHIGREQYPVPYVILDTGAEKSFFPIYLSKRLALSLDSEYSIVQGATGIAFQQDSKTPVRIEIVDKNGEKIQNTILPSFITKTIPKAQIDDNPIFEHEKYHFRETELHDLDLAFDQKTDFSALVETEKSPKAFNKRFKIKKYTATSVGITRSREILLGRDWQRDMVITFQNSLVKLKKFG